MNQDTAPQPPKTVVLPLTRAAQTWDRATDALVAAAEADEAKAREAYEAAKAVYQEKRQAAHLIRQLRQIARVDGVPDKPAPVSTINGETPWSRKYDACQRCGTTTRKYLARGFCAGCYYPATREAAS